MVVISLKKKRKYLLVFAIMVIAFVLCFYDNHPIILTNARIPTYRMVIDAGHGKPDGGAVSQDGIEEEALNLAIALKLREELENLGYDIIMTRQTHENIADQNKQSTLKEMKQSDLSNRVTIANNSHADFMISIHMNKFSQSSSWGWQTFYSKNSKEGKRLAMLVQNSLSTHINRQNKRGILPIEGIKIVEKTNLPVIIVECGFLSNEEDLRLLQTKEYQQKIVEGIVEAIEKYYE